MLNFLYVYMENGFEVMFLFLLTNKKLSGNLVLCILQQGIYWQVGDIVSLMDHESGIYYAQIRGFLQDQYCNKSAVITWLLPSTNSPQDTFHPATYILGL